MQAKCERKSGAESDYYAVCFVGLPFDEAETPGLFRTNFGVDIDAATGAVLALHEGK